MGTTFAYILPLDLLRILATVDWYANGSMANDTRGIAAVTHKEA